MLPWVVMYLVAVVMFWVFSSPKVLFSMLVILRFCNSFSMRYVAPMVCMLVYVVVGVFVVVWVVLL